MTPRIWALSSLLVLSSLPARAGAAAMPPEPMAVPIPGVLVRGTASVSELVVRVRCDDLDLITSSTVCRLEASFVLTPTSGEPIELMVSDASSAELRVDGSTTLAPITSAVTVTLTLSRGLAITLDHDDDFLVLLPIRLRHLFLGESTATDRSGDGAYGDLISPNVTLLGPVRVEVSAPAEITVNVGGQSVDGTAEITVPYATVALVLAVPPSEPQVVTHGGPVLGMGARVDLSRADEGRFLLRGSYELGIADYVIASIGFESDFESIMESVMIEVASPEVLVMIPSFAAGVGVVARQLGNRDADAALRLRLGFHILAMGLSTDFDYWPAIGDWTGSFVARLSF